jgi:hypothetical protein
MILCFIPALQGGVCVEGRVSRKYPALLGRELGNLMSKNNGLDFDKTKQNKQQQQLHLGPLTLMKYLMT